MVRGYAAHVARFSDCMSVDVRSYPRKRTLIAGLGMSAKCHERTIKVRVKRSGERVRCGRPPRERPHIQGLLSYCAACALTACSTCLFTARPVVVSGPGTFPWPFLFVESRSFILRFAGVRDRVRHRISGVSHFIAARPLGASRHNARSSGPGHTIAWPFLSRAAPLSQSGE